VGTVIPMFKTLLRSTGLLALALVSNLCLSAQTQPVPSSAAPAAPATKSLTVPSRYWRQPLAKSAREYYALIWGIDSLTVKSAESGEIIKFTYRVLDPDKAKVLNDKKIEPKLNDPTAGVSLVIPELEKVGKLRQSSTPEAGKVYWMAFSNKGTHVLPGHHVNVVIGTFHADGLIVQ
jgi:hypothetical protein